MDEDIRNKIEGLIGTYKHKVHLFETYIGTKQSLINSKDAAVKKSQEYSNAILDVAESKAKMESYQRVIDELEEALR